MSKKIELIRARKLEGVIFHEINGLHLKKLYLLLELFRFTSFLFKFIIIFFKFFIFI